jgi:catechol 2,3-dioxygenase-like lactoylglutathione lyase family enzyme
MQIESIHHVSLIVRDLERSVTFYREILGLQPIERPPFGFPGAWFAVGPSQHVHLIVRDGSTFPGEKAINTRDGHFAVRVPSYRNAVDFLHSKGYREGADPTDLHSLRLQPHATAGFPQIYILDPDRNLIEINAATLD